jgi:hypothetical protein
MVRRQLELAFPTFHAEEKDKLWLKVFIHFSG